MGKEVVTSFRVDEELWRMELKEQRVKKMLAKEVRRDGA